MAKYIVSIPRPSAKRMEGSGELIVKHEGGWMRSYETKYKLDPEAKTYEFEVEDKIPWFYSCSILDAHTFVVYIKYTNSTKSKEETKNLVPEKVP